MYHHHHPAWPTPHPAHANAAAPELAAASTHIPHTAFHTAYPHGNMYHHYHPMMRYRRFGLFRRFVWFGAGAAVATWYYHKQNRLLPPADTCTSTGANPSISHNNNNNNTNERWSNWRRDWNDWHEARHRQWDAAAATAIANPVQSSGPIVTPMQPIIPSTVESVLSSESQTSGQAPAQAEKQQQERQAERKRWGWSHRHHRTAPPASTTDAQQTTSSQTTTLAPAQSQTLAPAPTLSTATTTAVPQIPAESDEIIKIREAVDRLYKEKVANWKVKQEEANEKAKEYARDKLEQLSVALETLRLSLSKEQDERAALDKKMV